MIDAGKILTSPVVDGVKHVGSAVMKKLKRKKKVVQEDGETVEIEVEVDDEGIFCFLLLDKLTNNV